MTLGFQSILLILLFFCGSALFSGMETGGYSLNRLRLHSLARKGNSPARRLRFVLADSHRFVFTVLIGNNIANYLLSRHVTQLYLRGMDSDRITVFGPLGWTAETAATLTLLLPLFLFGELLPKNVFYRHADRLMYPVSGVLWFFERLFWPLAFPLKRIFSWLTGGGTRALSGLTLSLQGLRDYFSEDSSRDLLSAHQKSMIDNLISMHRIPAQRVMRPLTEIPAVPEEEPIGSVIQRMRERGVEQMIVYRGSARRVTGWVSLFDLMDPSINLTEPAKRYLRKTLRIPAAQPLNRAFYRLRTAPEAPAIVTGRSFRALGVLHLRDVARHIVSAG